MRNTLTMWLTVTLSMMCVIPKSGSMSNFFLRFVLYSFRFQNVESKSHRLENGTKTFIIYKIDFYLYVGLMAKTESILKNTVCSGSYRLKGKIVKFKIVSGAFKLLKIGRFHLKGALSKTGPASTRNILSGISLIKNIPNWTLKLYEILQQIQKMCQICRKEKWFFYKLKVIIFVYGIYIECTHFLCS